MPNQPTWEALDALQELISYRFQNHYLLLEALAHRSYFDDLSKHQATLSCNERLEFLGNYVLDYAVARELFRRFRTAPSGRLSLMKSILASNKTLNRIGTEIGLGKLIFTGNSYGKKGKPSKPIANALEALIGAIHEDHSLEEASSLTIGLLESNIEELASQSELRDAKSLLQTRTSREFGVPIPSYNTSLTENGLVRAEVRIGSLLAGIGYGSSKADAHQAAAKDALQKIRNRELTPQTVRLLEMHRR